jgi:hypothetical protein
MKGKGIKHLADPPRTNARFQRCGFGSKIKCPPINAARLAPLLAAVTAQLQAHGLMRGALFFVAKN